MRRIRSRTRSAKWRSSRLRRIISNLSLKTSTGAHSLRSILNHPTTSPTSMEISERAAQLSPSLTLSIDSKAKAMKAEGIDVCGFGAGEPDFDTPEHIKQAAIAALESVFTKYTPSAGLPELRQAIAEKLEADNQISYRASQIVVSSGAKHSCYNAILATCQPGDEVLIPSPYWVSYPDMVRLAGAEPVIVPTMERMSWKMRAEDFENAMTPRTKMLILNSPGTQPARFTLVKKCRRLSMSPPKRTSTFCPMRF